MIVGKPAEAPAPAVFLIGTANKAQPVVQPHPGAPHDRHSHQLTRQQGLAVGRPAAVNATTGNFGGERFVIPLGFILNRNDISVRHQHQSSIVVAARIHRNNVSTIRVAGKNLGGEVLAVQPVSDEFGDHSFTARWHESGVDRWNSHQGLFQLYDFTGSQFDLVQETLE